MSPSCAAGRHVVITVPVIARGSWWCLFPGVTVYALQERSLVLGSVTRGFLARKSARSVFSFARSCLWIQSATSLVSSAILTLLRRIKSFNTVSFKIVHCSPEMSPIFRQSCAVNDDNTPLDCRRNISALNEISAIFR